MTTNFKFKNSFYPEWVTESKRVELSDCDYVTFENLGANNAVIFDNIPLNAGQIRQFPCSPFGKMEQSVELRFVGAGAQNVLVIKRFVYDIEAENK